MQRPDRLLVLRATLAPRVRKHLVQPLHRLTLPRADLVRVYLMLRRDRLHRVLPSQRLQRHSLLEAAVNRRRLIAMPLPSSRQ